jgi:hypothetical protein
MFRLTIVSMAAVTSLLLHTHAFAGMYDARNAQVVVSGNIAHGSVSAVSARSPGSFIACNLDSAQPAAVTCRAQDARGASTYCTAANPPRVWVEMVSGINELSYISFLGDAQHVCRSITVQQGSQFT